VYWRGREILPARMSKPGHRWNKSFEVYRCTSVAAGISYGFEYLKFSPLKRFSLGLDY
jgi:hypothetical protein